MATAFPAAFLPPVSLRLRPVASTTPVQPACTHVTACAKPGTPQRRSRRIPEYFSTTHGNPMTTAEGQQRQFLRIQRLRKQRNWRLALSILEAIREHVERSSAFLTEEIHIQALSLFARQPDIPPLTLYNDLLRTIRASPAKPVEATFNAILCALQKRYTPDVSNDVLDVALRVIDRMPAFGLTPDEFSFSLVYTLCSMANHPKYLRLFEQRAQTHLASLAGPRAGSSLVCTRARMGQFDSAEHLLDHMIQRDLITNDRPFSCLIGAAHRAKHHHIVVNLYNKAISLPNLSLTSYVFSGVIASACRVADVVLARSVLEYMLSRNIPLDEAIVEGAFRTAIKAGDLPLASDALFDWAAPGIRNALNPPPADQPKVKPLQQRKPPRGNTTPRQFYTSAGINCIRLISVAARNKAELPTPQVVNTVRTVVDRMEGLGLPVDIHVMNAVASALVRLGELDGAREIVENGLSRRGLSANVASYNVLIQALGSAGRLADASKVPSTMREKHVYPNQTTYNCLLDMARLSEDNAVWSSVLEEIERNPSLKMDTVTITVVLNRLRQKRDPDAAMRVYKRFVQSGMRLDAKAYGLLLALLHECGREADAIGVFGYVIVRGLARGVVYNVLIYHFGKRRNGYEIAERLLAHMKRRGIVPDEVTYTSMIRVCARNGRMDRAFRLVAEMQDVGVSMSDAFAWTALIDGCGRCGMWERGVELLRTMSREGGGSHGALVPRPTVACYNAALYAAGIHGGEWKIALEIWQALLTDKSVAADHVSFSAMGSILLANRFEVVEIDVVQDVVDHMRAIVESEVKTSERRKLEMKIRRLEWILKHKGEFIRNPAKE